MKHKRFPRILLVIALVAVLTTTVYAYMFHKSQTVSNVFKPAKVTCKIHEVFDGRDKSSITVENTGNIDAYIRVRLAFHWEDSKGNIVARDRIPLVELDENGQKVDIKVDYDDSKWKQVDPYTYYYLEPVAPGASTSNLLKNSFRLNPQTETDPVSGVEFTYYPVMEVLAEAIQANPADAENEAWNKIP